jgi:hypothetical protein
MCIVCLFNLFNLKELNLFRKNFFLLECMKKKESLFLNKVHLNTRPDINIFILKKVGFIKNIEKFKNFNIHLRFLLLKKESILLLFKFFKKKCLDWFKKEKTVLFLLV